MAPSRNNLITVMIFIDEKRFWINYLCPSTTAEFDICQSRRRILKQLPELCIFGYCFPVSFLKKEENGYKARVDWFVEIMRGGETSLFSCWMLDGQA